MLQQLRLKKLIHPSHDCMIFPSDTLAFSQQKDGWLLSSFQEQKSLLQGLHSRKQGHVVVPMSCGVLVRGTTDRLIVQSMQGGEEKGRGKIDPLVGPAAGVTLPTARRIAFVPLMSRSFLPTADRYLLGLCLVIADNLQFFKETAILLVYITLLPLARNPAPWIINAQSLNKTHSRIL
jgi:hypothetical protein